MTTNFQFLNINFCEEAEPMAKQVVNRTPAGQAIEELIIEIVATFFFAAG